MKAHQQVIPDSAKYKFCKSKGSGRYTTDWVVQQSTDRSVFIHSKSDRDKLRVMKQ